MKIWPSHLKSMIGLLIACCVAPPVGAVQQSGSVPSPAFTCSLSFGSCACDGTYENCNAMEKNCKDQKIACTMINNQRLCTCLMATKINAPPAH
jgi:hypothetical protein